MPCIVILVLERSNMLSANYTAENICRALGLGSFANDLQLAAADEAIRVLLVPSFHREVCISLLRQANTVRVSVVAARTQIWLQDWPVPQSTPVDQESMPCSGLAFAELSSSLCAAAESRQSQRYVILDGMRAHTVLRADRQGKYHLDQHVSANPLYTAFIAEAITLAHRTVTGPGIRNALADAGSYVGLRMPTEPTPPTKDLVRTMVLGSPDETGALLDALRQRHAAGD